MKLNVDIKNKKGELNADVEKLIEKHIDNENDNWEKKFSLKHNAKIEEMKLKHEQKVILEEKKHERKNFIDKIEDRRQEKIRLKLELERKKQEELKRTKTIRIVIACTIAIIGLIIVISAASLSTGEADDAHNFICAVGFLMLLASPLVVLIHDDKK